MKTANEQSDLNQTGLTRIDILVTVLSIGLLIWVATLGRMNHAIINRRTPESICLRHIEQIEQAKLLWLAENQKGNDAVPTAADLKPLMVNGAFPKCPSGGACSINAVNIRATCSVHSFPSNTGPQIRSLPIGPYNKGGPPVSN